MKQRSMPCLCFPIRAFPKMSIICITGLADSNTVQGFLARLAHDAPTGFRHMDHASPGLPTPSEHLATEVSPSEAPAIFNALASRTPTEEEEGFTSTKEGQIIVGIVKRLFSRGNAGLA